MSLTQNQKVITVLFMIVWIWAAINPVSRTDWFLENLPIFILLPVFLFSPRSFKLSDRSVALIALFLILHLVGTHYTYEQVPFGNTLELWLGSTRNMYDRLVHFAFGFLLVLPTREMFSNIIDLRSKWSFCFPVGAILAGAAVYEIFEWCVANFVSPHLKIAFIGSQGDLWDTQKDMAMALFGALAMTIIIALWRMWRARV